MLAPVDESARPAGAALPVSPYVGVFRGVSRELTTTALGHPAAVSCHNCYAGSGNAPLSLAAANARIAKAVAEGADFIELDVIEVGGLLYASHSDVAAKGSLPLLTDLLAAPALRDTDTLLVIEVKEADADPLLFADALLSALSTQSTRAQVVREGRPLFLKSFNTKLAYLLALKNKASEWPSLTPYLRYYLLHSGLASLSELQQELEEQAVENGLDGIDLFFRTPHLAAISGYMRSLGLGVGVWTVPGPALGELGMLALREQADVITTDLPLDRARALVEAQNVRTHFDARDLAAAADLTVFSVTPFSASKQQVLLEPSAPILERGAVGDVMFGGALRFAQDKALTLPPPGPSSSPGFVVSALVRFNSLTLLPNQTMPILAQLDEGAFRFELARGEAGGTELRFGVNVDGAFRYRSRSVAGDASASCDGLANVAFVPALDTEHAYLLTGVYTPEGRVLLFINLQCAGVTAPVQMGNLKSSQAGVRLGRPLGLEDERVVAFDGSVQRIDVLDW